MLNISIKTIPHKAQRYVTCGDYWKEKHHLQVRISELGNKKFEFLLCIHELIESFLCELNGVHIQQIDAFDINFEKERKQGLHSDTAEPGDSKKAPYYLYHQIATGFERLLAAVIGVDWEDYSSGECTL